VKLSELKQRVYSAWECLSDFNDALIQQENFLQEVRAFGDLRRKLTWQKAYCSFWARNIFDSNSDNRSLITVFFNYTPAQWDWELRHEIIDQFLTISGGLDCIINGLEQIFNYPINKEEEETALGVLKLVQEQSGGSGRIAVGVVRQFADSNQTRTS
jgi:hypothetical protein